MKRIKLKLIRYLLIPGILSIFLIGGTYAYYSESFSFKNPFYIGVPGVSMAEKFNPSDQWVPGEEKRKEVWFKNEGKLDVLVRFKPEITWEDKNGRPMTSVPPEDAVTLNWADAVKNQTEWTKIGDYYYYKKVLKHPAKAPNKENETGQVLKSVTFSSNLTNDGHEEIDYSGTQCNVNIIMESVVASADEAAKNWPKGAVPTIHEDGSVTWK